MENGRFLSMDKEVLTGKLIHRLEIELKTSRHIIETLKRENSELHLELMQIKKSLQRMLGSE